MVSMSASRRVRIHLPWTSVAVPALLAVCVMPMAGAGGAWSVVYALPALALLAVVFAGTTATASHLSARWLHGWTRLAWDEVAQLEFPPHRWAVVVTQSGRRVALPGVRPADLPRIVAAAGGRLFLRRPAGERPDGGDDGDPEVGSDGAEHAGDEAAGPASSGDGVDERAARRDDGTGDDAAVGTGSGEQPADHDPAARIEPSASGTPQAVSADRSSG